MLADRSRAPRPSLLVQTVSCVLKRTQDQRGILACGAVTAAEAFRLFEGDMRAIWATQAFILALNQAACVAR